MLARIVSWFILAVLALAVLWLRATLTRKRPPLHLLALLRQVAPDTMAPAAQVRPTFRRWSGTLITALVVLGSTAILYLVVLIVPLVSSAAMLFLVGGGIFTICIIAYVAVQPGTHLETTLTIVGALGVFGLWFLWPNWITADLFAVVVVAGCINGFLSITTTGFRWVSLVVGAYTVYDLLHVFLTGKIVELVKVVTVPDRVLPILFVVPREWSLAKPTMDNATMLGLGDMILPGLLITSAGIVAYRCGKMVILHAGLAGYFVGLLFAFVGARIMHAPQPALLYLYPCIMGTVVGTAWKLGVVRELFGSQQMAGATVA